MQPLTLYVATWCDPCHELQEWLKDHDVGVTLVNAGRMSRSERTSLGIFSVPTMKDSKGNLYIGREQIKPFIEGRSYEKSSN